MSKEKRIGLFIFRRDLRIVDNTGLIAACKECDKVGITFFLTPEQLNKERNKYFSNNAVQFMMESLDELDNETDGKLIYFEKNPEESLEEVLKKNPEITDVYVNIDYTPYSTKRDNDLAEVCMKHDVDFNGFEDLLLIGEDQIKTTTGGYYTKYTPYYKSALKIKIPKPNTYNVKSKLFKIKGGTSKLNKKKFYKENSETYIRGGRKNGLKILETAGKEYKNYGEKRNCLTYDTTHLSAYNKFGCVSIREVYYAVEKIEQLVAQLHWRDFYTQMLYHDPSALKGPQRDTMKYLNSRWENDKTKFKAWCEGKTGFPIVDACMRQLNTTGWMHNRGRLIVSNFLIKLLRIDWRWGERYFAQNLIDYDVAVNNGNWQWSAGTGSDVQGYVRIFNPWTQMEKFDPKAEYTKKWVPELSKLNSKDLLKWDNPKIRNEKRPKDYPEPIIDYKKAREQGLKLYKKP